MLRVGACTPRSSRTTAAQLASTPRIRSLRSTAWVLSGMPGAPRSLTRSTTPREDLDEVRECVSSLYSSPSATRFLVIRRGVTRVLGL
ncbi:hypothetical protein ATE80_09940 [Streptomyces kanasensis]|uniref:Uncharacterized protein n=1 Tax=Streptomyces kanasensis TaxID=936756 RepID=A0A117IWR9_9ACTN|nr:hypothetical protein ATE80_09940 [Streptomyces kanasensis]